MRSRFSSALLGTVLVSLVVFSGCQSTELTSAKLYIQQQNWKKAGEQLLLAVNNEPTNAEPAYLLGSEIYNRSRNWVKMVKYLDLASSISSQYTKKAEQVKKKYWIENFNNGANNYNAILKGTAKDGEAAHTTAVNAFKTCIIIDPQKSDSYTTLAQVYLQHGDIDSAKATMEEAIKLDAPDIANFINLGAIYYKEKAYERALTYFDRALEIDSSNVSVIKQIAFVYDAMGDKLKAVGAYKNAIAADPKNPDLLYNLGVLYFQQKNFKDAATHFIAVSKLTPDASDAFFNAGLAYERMEDYKTAKGYLEQAYAIDQSNKELVHELKLIYYRLGNTKKYKEFEKLEKSM